jgi:hypothetical protein
MKIEKILRGFIVCCDNEALSDDSDFSRRFESQIQLDILQNPDGGT